MVLWLYAWEPLTLGHHAANFGGLRDCGSADKTLSNCHMISKDHMFKGLKEFICHSKSPDLFMINGQRPCGIRDIYLSYYLVRPCDQRGLGLYGRKLLIAYPYPVNFSCHNHCGSGYIMV